MFRHIATFLCLALLLGACSPALNWREVRTDDGDLKTLLPCQPDRGARQQPLGSQEVMMTMLGCEAGGAMFAVAVAELGATDKARAAQAQWQARTLTNMQADSSAVTPVTIRGAGSEVAPQRVSARGLQPDGRPVELQAVWFARGTRLYHAAIYAGKVSDEMQEPFFDGLALQ